MQLDLSTCSIDLAQKRVSTATASHRLSAIEARMLGYFLSRPGQLVRSAELVVAVWGNIAAPRNRMYLAVQRLRRKLEIDPAHPQHLLTIYGIGFRFEPGPTRVM